MSAVSPGRWAEIEDELRTEFDALVVPDHAEDSAWVARGRVTDLSGPVVFLVHPTTSAAPGWFADPEDADVRSGVDAVVNAQSAAFPGILWAPRYRQASTRAFHRRREGGEAAYDLAYEDVSRAFSQFLVDDARVPGPRRPLVVVGHSQGARHVRALLAEYFDHVGLAQRLVAVYLVGVPIALDDPLLLQFPAAREESESGVVVSYQVRLDGEHAVPFPVAPGTLCTPPAALGMTSPTPVVDRGYLVIAPETAGVLGERALPDGRLHHVEIEVLASALSADVRRRTRAWRHEQAVGQVEEPPVDVTQSRVATPLLGADLAVEQWRGVRGRVWSVPQGLMHVVDLPGPAESGKLPVVLLHKLGGWAAEWRGVARLLAAERRVLVVDLPGHGASAQELVGPWIHWPQESARSVRAVLEQLGVERAHFMGASLGGVVASWIAARRPQQVASLALVGSSLTPPLSAARTWEIDRAVASGFAPGWVPRPGQNARAATTDAAVLREQDASRSRAGRWVRASERGVGLAGVDHVVAQVSAPLLYVNGERAGYRAYEETVRTLVAQVQVEVVAEAGSFVHQERPAEVARIWSEFVAGGAGDCAAGGAADGGPRVPGRREG